MSRKQKTAITSGFVILIAMALFPPWAAWCVPIHHKTYQYGWILGQLNYPECAEKFDRSPPCLEQCRRSGLVIPLDSFD